jgi:hypothetical protein
MQDVYSGAYYTIAVTLAVNSNAGFFKQSVCSNYVYIQDNLGR